MNELPHRLGVLGMSGQPTNQAPQPYTLACPFPTCDEAPAKKSFLNISGHGKIWEMVDLCGRGKLLIDGRRVAEFGQFEEEPTLCIGDERKMFNYEICVGLTLLKEGFAKKYAEYERMCLKDSQFGDENFQAFLFMKWLNSTNKDLHKFFNLCLHEDRENLYKAWLMDVCGFFKTLENQKNERMLTKPEEDLHKYLSLERKIMGKKCDTEKVKKELHISKGTELVDLFLKVLGDHENSKKTYFTIQGKPLFTLKRKNEFGKGLIVFSPDVKNICPRWETFPKTAMKKGFKNRYDAYHNGYFRDFGEGCELDRDFQAFVLLQLEIARAQVKYATQPERAQLSSKEVEEGIYGALYMDREKYYKHLTQMFIGEKKRQYYDLLKTRVEIEERITNLLY